MALRSVPRHVAVIMDGNGRWAVQRGYPRVFGHVRGARRVKEIAREADRLGVKALTLYAFSTENWARPAQEVETLWRLLKKYLIREIDELDRMNVRLHVIGELDRLAPDVREAVLNSIERLADNTGLALTFALSYGGRRELVAAARRFAEECVAGRAKPDELDERALEGRLWTAGLGALADVDLVLRTGGESRVSNFLLWQLAYAELLFVERNWPDFTAPDFAQALEAFGDRDRRFGAISPSVAGATWTSP